MGASETDLQQRIRLALGTRPDLRLFRNNTGTLPDPRTGRPVQFGLARGSADLIGYRTVTITPEMVGQRVAIFTSLEVKTPTGRIRPDRPTGSVLCHLLVALQPSSAQLMTQSTQWTQETCWLKWPTLLTQGII